MIAAFFIICSTNIVVKHVEVLHETTNEEVEKENQMVRDEYNEDLRECSKVYKEKECKALLSYMLDSIYTNEELLNKTLSELPKNTNLLHLSASNFYGLINFNVLPSKMLVYLESSTTAINANHEDKFNFIQKRNQRFVKKMKEVKFNGSPKSFLELSKSLCSRDKLPKYEYMEKIYLVGDIGNKVPFITFDNVVLEIVDSNFNCENAYFKSVILKGNSKYINVKNLIIDEPSHRSLNLDKFNVTQYIINLRDSDKYYFQYESNKLKVLKYEPINQEIMDQNLDIPYKITKIIGFYTTTEEIEIKTIVRKSYDAFPNLNLTISRKIVEKPSVSSDKLTITEEGWKKFEGIKPTVFLAIDPYVSLDTTGVSNIEIKNSPIPEYQYPNNEDNNNNKKKTAIIIGIVVAVVVVIAIIIIVVIVVRKKKTNDESRSEGGEEADKA